MFEDLSSSYFKYDPFYWDKGGDTSRKGQPWVAGAALDAGKGELVVQNHGGGVSPYSII